MQIPPGSASVSSRAAMLTQSPKMSSPETITSPILTPMRKRICSDSATPALRSATPRWIRMQQPVARGLHNAAAAGRDGRIDDVAAQAIEARKRPGLVLAHQTAVADEVGGEHRRQPPVNRAVACLFHHA